MRTGLLYVLPFVVSFSAASWNNWNNSRPVSAPTSPSNNTFISPSAAQACSADCVIHFDNHFSYRWQSYVVNTTITAATVLKTVYPKYNATKVRTYANDLPSGYDAPDRNEAGTVVTTLTLNGGNNASITTVLAYPTAPTDSSNSYWWSGVLPTTTAGLRSCLTQLAPATVQLPSLPQNAKATSSVKEPPTYGTNYYLVSKILPNPLPSLYPDDPILAACHQSSISINAMLDSEPRTTAYFITVTSTRTETKCRPDMACNVRSEVSETGPLIGPSRSASSPSRVGCQKASTPNHMKQGPAGCQNVAAPHVVHPEVSDAGLVGTNRPGFAGALTVHSERPGPTLIAPTRAPAAAAGDILGPGPALQVPTALPMSLKATPAATPAPALPPIGVLGTVTVGSTTLTVSAVPAHISPVGPHIEQSQGSLVQVGSNTVTVGVLATVNNQPFLITTVAGGATVAIVGSTQGNGKAEILRLDGGGGGAGDAGGILAPKTAAEALSASSPITIGGTVLTPGTAGGFFVSGASLVLGGAPITVYGDGVVGSGSGIGTAKSSGGARLSPTVLSLTTNAAGSEILVVNGKTSILPNDPLETGRGKPAQYIGTSGSLLPTVIGPDSASASSSVSGGGGKKSSAPDRITGVRRNWCGYGMIILMMIVSR